MENTIIVRSQAELDAISPEYSGTVRINFGTKSNPAVVKNADFLVEVYGDNVVHASDNCKVVAHDHSKVTAWDSCKVYAWDNSTVTVWNNSKVTAWDSCKVYAWDNSTVTVWNNCKVHAHDNSKVYASDDCTVVASDNSKVTAWGNCKVTHCNPTPELDNHSEVIPSDNTTEATPSATATETVDPITGEVGGITPVTPTTDNSPTYKKAFIFVKSTLESLHIQLVLLTRVKWDNGAKKTFCKIKCSIHPIPVCGEFEAPNVTAVIKFLEKDGWSLIGKVYPDMFL